MHEFVMSLLQWFGDLGYLGIALGLMIEIIPSEIVLAYGGFLESTGKITFVGAVIAGTIGGVLAQLFLYWLGYYGGRPVLEKYGKYLLIKKKHLDLSTEWFERYGTGVIFAARFVPVVRHAISIPAGIAKMSVWRFILLTTLAVIPWSIIFILLGSYLGENYDKIDEVAGPYTTPIGIGIAVIMILYFGIKWWRKKNSKSSVDLSDTQSLRDN